MEKYEYICLLCSHEMKVNVKCKYKIGYTDSPQKIGNTETYVQRLWVDPILSYFVY